MHTENLWHLLDPRCLEMFVENPLNARFSGCQPLLLLLSHSPSCGTQKWGSFVFILSPNGSFPPLFYLPVSQNNLSLHQFLEALVISKEESLLLSGKPVGDSTETQCYFSYQNYGRRRTSIFLYKALEDDLVTLRNLKIGFWGRQRH